MKLLRIELLKERRTGVSAVLIAVGILGALYAFVNFQIRKETLLQLPLPPMDVLMTQVYGMIMVLNLFAILVADCMMYSMEFHGGALRKLYVLPIRASQIYLIKFLILAVELFLAVLLQNAALAWIGLTELPPGTFHWQTLITFAGYSYLTSLPVLSFMLLIASRFENIWVPVGIGVAGFLSGMALATSKASVFLIDPFVLMLQPAMALSAQPQIPIAVLAAAETLLFFLVGFWMADFRKYE